MLSTARRMPSLTPPFSRQTSSISEKSLFVSIRKYIFARATQWQPQILVFYGVFRSEMNVFSVNLNKKLLIIREMTHIS